jgi:hypothetical protein
MKSVFATASLLAALVALSALAPAARAGEAPDHGPVRMKTGHSGRVYVWRPGGC